MSFKKTLIALTMTILCFNGFAKQSEPDMTDNKTLVIKYDYTPEQVIKESSVKLHKNANFAFHSKGGFNLEVLGEKNKIIVPGLSESFLVFDKEFIEVTSYILPINQWLNLNDAIEKIKQMRSNLKDLEGAAISSKAFDINQLNDKYFEKETAQMLNKFELKHYKVFFYMKKLNTPKEVHPRDKDYFQLLVRVENIKM